MENQAECLIPHMTEERAAERRAWFAKHFPGYMWPEKLVDPVDGSEIDAEELADRIRRVLRDMAPRAV